MIRLRRMLSHSIAPALNPTVTPGRPCVAPRSGHLHGELVRDSAELSTSYVDSRGTLEAVQFLQEAFLVKSTLWYARDDIQGILSGGSINSLCDLTSTYGAARIAAASAPFRLAPVPRRSAEITSRGVLPGPNIFGVQTVYGLGALVTSTQAEIETAIVGRSWGLYAGVAHDSQRPDSYGQDFYFSSRMRCTKAFTGWGFRTAYLLLTKALANIRPQRTLVSRRLFPAGTGPSVEERVGNHFSYRTVALADMPKDTAAPQVEVTFAYDGDPYVFTGVSLTEAALVLLEGGTPAHERGRGILTPALLGDKFAERLKRPEADVKIDVKVIETKLNTVVKLYMN